MIRAYDKVYLDKARTVLARMLDFAVWELGYGIDEFFAMFIKTGLAKRFAEGEFTLLVGMSGVELAYKVLEMSGIETKRIKVVYASDRSKEYWVGWALAYYQWYTALSFKEIVEFISLEGIRVLYSPYHEMDIRHFVDKLNELYKSARVESNLKTIRKNAGLSQNELAELSGVPLRTIQQYEQRKKNINNAKAVYLIMLAKALVCNVDDLIEKVA